MKRKSRDKQDGDRLDALEKDLQHVMGRGETSDVSGIPTMVSAQL